MSSSSISIIRIAGTSYSGSTALDLMLANADDAFSCGEIDALFRPYRMHHFEPECGCGDPLCKVWREIRNGGEKQWPETLARMFPQTKWIVDSSKDLNWIVDQNNLAQNTDSPVHNLLIWKNPADYAYSLLKRGKIRGWLRRYMLYHERYLSITNDWIGVPYSEVAAKPADTLKSLCALLNMGYVAGREHFWMRQHHTLFGNHSAKLHLHDKNTGNYQSIAKDLKVLKPGVEGGSDQEVAGHKSIYYKRASLESLPRNVARDIETNQALHDLVAHLEKGGISHVDAFRRDQGTLRQPSSFSSPGIWYHYLNYKRLAFYYTCLLRRSTCMAHPGVSRLFGRDDTK